MQAVLDVAHPYLYLSERDDDWLRERLNDLWDRYFFDTPRANTIRISFGPFWKSRLGLITMSLDEATTYIVLNGLLRNPEVPDVVINVTVAHELVHYAHGFGSPLARRYKHPHRGGIVKRELVRRGLAADYDWYDEWVYGCWYDFYDRQMITRGQNVRPMSDWATIQRSVAAPLSG